jgi:putative membrane protein
MIFPGTFFPERHPIIVNCNQHPRRHGRNEEIPMSARSLLAALAGLCLAVTVPALAQDKPTDPQIAHIAYTAGVIDIEAAKIAVGKSKTKAVVDFANDMIRDHEAVNVQALDLVKKLGVTPEDNDTSKALGQAAEQKRAELAALDGAAFDKAYVENEVAYHKQVNGALETLLIPSAQNAELKGLLETGLKLFQGHQAHAEHVAAELK